MPRGGILVAAECTINGGFEHNEPIHAAALSIYRQLKRQVSDKLKQVPVIEAKSQSFRPSLESIRTAISARRRGEGMPRQLIKPLAAGSLIRAGFGNGSAVHRITIPHDHVGLHLTNRDSWAISRHSAARSQPVPQRIEREKADVRLHRCYIKGEMVE